MLSHLILLTDGAHWVLGGLSPFFKSLLQGKPVEQCYDLILVDDIPDVFDRNIVDKVCFFG